MGSELTVVWIMFDSLRKDVFDRCCHPFLEELRSTGTSFDNVHSQSGFTLLSCSSMWTGLYPPNCDTNIIDPSVRANESWVGKVAVPVRKLTQRTAFDAFRRSVLAFEPGTTAWNFDRPDVTYLETNADTARASLRLTQMASDESNRGSLWFLRVFGTHLPYAPPSSPLEAHLHFRQLGRLQAARSAVADIVARKGERAVADLQLIALEYAIDVVIAPFIEKLRSIAEAEGLLIVLCSDHGDQYSTNPHQVGHGRFYSKEVVRVPLLLSGPGISRRRFATPVALVDVLPTILELCGLPTWHMDGRSLLRLMNGESDASQAHCILHNTMRGDVSVMDSHLMVTRSLLDNSFRYYRDWCADDRPSSAYCPLESTWHRVTARQREAFASLGAEPSDDWPHWRRPPTKTTASPN